MKTQNAIPGHVEVKVSYVSSQNTCMMQVENTAFIFSPVWFRVSNATIEFFGRLETAAQYSPFGYDLEAVTMIIPEKVYSECLSMAGTTIDLN